MLIVGGGLLGKIGGNFMIKILNFGINGKSKNFESIFNSKLEKNIDKNF